jgi:hypothetical protein
MALTAPSVEELLRIVRGHYPAGIDVYEHHQGYRNSPESRALNDARQRAVDERSQTWRELKRGFIDRYGRDQVADWTHWLDACFHFRVYTPSSTPDNKVAAVLLVSFLAPIHITYTVFERRIESGPLPARVVMGLRPETEVLTRELDREATERMQSVRIDWELLQVPVPEISTDHRAFGEATLADLLFTNDWQ